MFNYAILLPYIGMVFLLGGCAALDKAMVPTSADTEINLKNDRVAVIVDACRYWSTMAFADNYFSKADALEDIRLISDAVSQVLNEKGIRHEILPLPFVCTFPGGYDDLNLKDKKSGDVIAAMRDAPHPVGSIDEGYQRLRDGVMRLECQYWQYKDERLGRYASHGRSGAYLYKCKQKGYLPSDDNIVADIPELERFDKLLVIDNFLVSSTLARSVVTLSSPPASVTSATVFDIKKKQFVWDDFRNERRKCWVSGGLKDYPTAEKVLAGLVCGIEASPEQ